MKTKKLVAILLTLTVIISGITVIFSSFSASAADSSSQIIGDANLNSRVDIDDATFIQQNLAKIKEFTEEQQILGDSDQDGFIRIIDATYVQNYLAKLTNTAHVGELITPTEPTTEEPTTEPTTEEPTISPDVPLADTVNEGTILQAWNWSFANVTKLLPDVKEAGFTTVQVSPPNEIKEATNTATVLQSNNKNGWWMFYQPAGFQLNNSSDNALGTKAEFVEMCKKAHELGVKIIVDTVINHMGTCDNEDSITSTDPMQHLTPKAKTFEPEIVNNKLFHSPWKEMQYIENPPASQYDSTYDLTRNCTSRLPDLKTEDPRVQSAIYDYMKELVEAGADGFRFDAAKHIETETDISGLRSEFWNNTLEKVRKEYAGKSECYAYGEILNTCGINRPFSMYLKHMDVTDSGSIWGISDAIRGNGGNATPFYGSGTTFSKENVILWDESHDTYTDKSTLSYSVDVRNRIWAITASRADITCVYLARPDDATNLNSLYSTKLGVANKTSWSNDITAQINKFHNRHIGDSEYTTSNSSGRAYVERGDSGCAIVGLGNTKGGSVSLANHSLKKGTYIDQISGNTFTVTKTSGGQIKGTVGSSGIALIEFLKDNDDPVPTSPTQGDDKPYPTMEGCYSVVITDSMGWGNIYFYCWGDAGEVAPWPGQIMQFAKQNDFGQNQYVAFVPYEQNQFIVSNGKNQDEPGWAQTADSVIYEDTGIYFDEEKDDQGRYVLKFWDINLY